MANTELIRVAMLSNDINPFFEIYHQIFGMNVARDNMSTTDGVSIPAGPKREERLARFVALTANHDRYGQLAMLAYEDNALAVPKQKDKLRAGDSIFIFNVADAEAIFKKVKKVKGVRVTSPKVKLLEYPNKNGGEPFRLKGFNFFDPYGYFIECNQWLSGGFRPDDLPSNIGVDLRRSTMLINHRDAFLKIYRDAFAMRVGYHDHLLSRNVGTIANFKKTPPKGMLSELFILYGNHRYLGGLGAMAHEIAVHPAKRLHQNTRLQQGDLVHVFSSTDIDKTYRRLKKIKGVIITAKPRTTTYPNPQNPKEKLTIKIMNLFDPNGYFMEIYQKS